MHGVIVHGILARRTLHEWAAAIKVGDREIRRVHRRRLDHHAPDEHVAEKRTLDVEPAPARDLRGTLVDGQVLQDAALVQINVGARVGDRHRGFGGPDECKRIDDALCRGEAQLAHLLIHRGAILGAQVLDILHGAAFKLGLQVLGEEGAVFGGGRGQLLQRLALVRGHAHVLERVRQRKGLVRRHLRWSELGPARSSPSGMHGVAFVGS